MNKIQKGQNPAATSQVPGAKAGYRAWSLHTAPPRGWADHLIHSGPTHRSAPAPALTPFKGPALPHWGSEQGYLLLVFTPSCCSTSPNKALPEFLVWPLINFYWLKSPRTQVSNIPALPTTLLSCPETPAPRSLGCSPKCLPSLGWTPVFLWCSSTTHTSFGKREGKQELLVRDKTEVPSWPRPQINSAKGALLILFPEQRGTQVLVQCTKGCPSGSLYSSTRPF